MRITRILAAAALLTALTLRAVGDEPPPAEAPAQPPAAPAEGDDLFTKVDANADGFVTREEIPDEQRRLFRRLMEQADKNGDGRLDRDEFTAGLKENRPKRPAPAAPDQGPAGGNPPPGDRPNPAQLFERIDANGDGTVTEDEMPEERRPRFARLLEFGDENKDGGLSREEFVAAMRKLAKRGESPPPGGPEGPGDKPGMGAVGERLLKAMDTDGDGVLSSGEIEAAAAALKKLDSDGDGSLSAGELYGPQSRAFAGGPPRPEQFLERIMQADEDGDGKLSEAECPPRLAQAFDKLDSDGDGFLDKPELKQGLAALGRFMEKNGKKASKGDKAKKGDKPKKKKPADETAA